MVLHELLAKLDIARQKRTMQANGKVKKRRIKTKVVAIPYLKKAKMIVELESGKKPCQIAKEYNTDKRTVGTIMKNKNKIKEALASGMNMRKVKRRRDGQYKEIEKELVEWIRRKRLVQKVQVSCDLARVSRIFIVYCGKTCFLKEGSPDSS